MSRTESEVAAVRRTSRIEFSSSVRFGALDQAPRVMNVSKAGCTCFAPRPRAEVSRPQGEPHDYVQRTARLRVASFR